MLKSYWKLLKITENHWNSQFTEILEKRFYWNLSVLLKETEILILLTAYWKKKSQPRLLMSTADWWLPCWRSLVLTTYNLVHLTPIHSFHIICNTGVHHPPLLNLLTKIVTPSTVCAMRTTHFHDHSVASLFWPLPSNNPCPTHTKYVVNSNSWWFMILSFDVTT